MKKAMPLVRRRIYTDPTIASSEITPESVFLNRRALMTASVASALAWPAAANAREAGATALPHTPDLNSGLETEKTPVEAVTSYNNFYEFGTDKSDPARHAHEMTTDPWTVSVGGLVNKPGALHLEDLLGGFDLEERIYRFRCVAAWSMAVPWVGFPLAALLSRFEHKSEARFV